MKHSYREFPGSYETPCVIKTTNINEKPQQGVNIVEQYKPLVYPRVVCPKQYSS